MPESYVKKIRSKQADLIHLVVGKDRGRTVWYYLQFESKAKMAMFNARSSNEMEEIAISEYGEILHSGWGKTPPSELTKELQEEYA